MTLALFGLLLCTAMLFTAMSLQQSAWIRLQLFVSSIEDRRHLIRAVQIERQRLPTAAELQQAQLASGVVWPLDVVASTATHLRWRIPLPRNDWNNRLLQRVGGEVIAHYWYSNEPSLF